MRETWRMERQKAIRLGEKEYFTGRPCPKGHIANRTVSNAGCCECHKENVRVFQSHYMAREDIKEKVRAWKRNPKYRSWSNLYRRDKKISDPSFKKAELIRTLLQKKIIRKRSRSKDYVCQYLGLSINNVRKYLESKFKEGMSWDNYGKWQIDHIRPLNSFDLTDKHQMLEAFNYKNIQPLWEDENRRKGVSLCQA